MAGPRLAAESFPEEQYVSAPSSADFLTQDIHEDNQWPVNSIKFQPEQGTLVLEVGNKNLVRNLLGQSRLEELAGEGFRLARGPHITIMNYGSGSNLLSRIEQYSSAGRAILLRDVERIAGSQDWSWEPTGDIHPFIGRSRGTLKLIAMVNCPGVVNFYNEIEELLPGVEIERHPMHITLLKKVVGIDTPIEETMATLGLPRPINSLNHLELGYAGSRPVPNTDPETSAPAHVIEVLMKRLRVDISAHQPLSAERQSLLEGVEQYRLPLCKDVVEGIREDLRHIDLLGANALGRRVSLVPEALEHFVPGAGLPIHMPEHSPSERARIFDEKLEDSLIALSAPQALSQRVVTGAILGIGELFNNERLLEEAGRRLTIDQNFYAHSPRSMGTYHALGTALMRELHPKEEVEDTSSSNIYPFPAID